MAIFKPLKPGSDIKASRSTLNQLIDIVQADISGSTTRKKAQVFVTGGLGPGVTSSLFQTIYDQNYTLQTANAIFDITMGLYYSGSTVLTASTGQDANGKLLFPSTSLMMREKVDVYRQFAQNLLGNANNAFYAPYNSTTTSDRVDNALFLSFKRLFARDSIKPETFALKLFSTASVAGGLAPFGAGETIGGNIDSTSTGSAMIITDVGSSQNKQQSVFGGRVGRLVDSSNASNSVGLVYYDQGCAILDMAKVISGSQRCSGSIDAISAAQTIDGASIAAGKTVMGVTANNPASKFIPDFMVSASMDNILDHFAGCRFQSGSALTAMTFQNQTTINSTLIFCRASADEFNYSANPTYVDSVNNIVVLDANDPTTRAFTMPTTIGLYDASDTLLAVAKLSRPVEKNDQKDITFRVRLDF
tara:strand:+ start:30658 stop:31911 length:1254 start_codon:yes stop_codon:yes gene_type:complete